MVDAFNRLNLSEQWFSGHLSTPYSNVGSSRAPSELNNSLEIVIVLGPFFAIHSSVVDLVRADNRQEQTRLFKSIGHLLIRAVGHGLCDI